MEFVSWISCIIWWCLLLLLNKFPKRFYTTWLLCGRPLRIIFFDIIRKKSYKILLKSSCKMEKCKDFYSPLWLEGFVKLKEYLFFLVLCMLQEELLEQQDVNLASTIRGQQPRALEFWEKNWVTIILVYFTLILTYLLFLLSTNRITSTHVFICIKCQPAQQCTP